MTDPFFGPAYVDMDEWRDAPVRHRYVHGGFEGTDTRFSIYLPPAEQYEGRFITSLEGGNGGHENTAMGGLGDTFAGIGFAFSRGAYLVESNQGHIGDDLSILQTEPTIHAYRASAQSARYSREVAAEMYGVAPHHGYVYGGSGGSARCILCLEKCPDVWDGAVPFIMGHSTSWPVGFSVQAHAARLLGDKINDVIDAVEPGGSGNPFDGLTGEQRDALAAMYRCGFPRGGEASFGTSGYVGTFASHVPELMTFDPTYFDDFWSKPGYAGGDGALDDALVDEKTTVKHVVTASELIAASAGDSRGGLATMFLRFSPPDAPLGLRVHDSDASRMLGSCIRIVTGAAAGRELYVTAVIGDVLLGGGGVSYRFEDVQPGDEVAIDNRRYLGYTHFHRHQVEPDVPECQHLMVDGRPVYPQRPGLFSQSGLLSGDTPSASFNGKMIVMQNAHDAACWPNAALSFRRAVAANLGDRLDDHYRLWFNDHAAHIPSSFIPPGKPPVLSTKLIDYGGSLEQALSDLIDWVELGKAPPDNSGFTMDHDQGLQLAPTAAERRGIQPVAAVSANGAERADVKAGSEVTLTASVEVPPGTGRIISVEWDFDGTGAFPHRHQEVDGSQSSATFTTSHTFSEPGTFFPCVRVTSHRDGDMDSTHCRIVNLGRVRVVVS